MLNRYEAGRSHLVLVGLTSSALLIACDAPPQEESEVPARLDGDDDGDDIIARFDAEDLQPTAEEDGDVPQHAHDFEADAAPAMALEPYAVGLPLRLDRMHTLGLFTSFGHGGSYGGTNFAIDAHTETYSGAWERYVQNEEHAGSAGGTDVLTSEAYAYGTPLFAPESGEVVGCWRNVPDKPGTGINYGYTSPISGGNHVLIRTDDGEHMIYLAHLMEDSIPSNVCPIQSNDEWPSTSRTTCSASGWPSKGLYEETVLANPVPIEAGQFLGRIGHSGASGAPHLHYGVYPLEEDANGVICYDDTTEMLFTDAWDQARLNEPSDDWNALDEENNLPGWHLFSPGYKHPATYSPDSYQLGDYDGDGEGDLLCHSVSDGRVWVDRMSDGLDGTDVSENHGFCDDEFDRLHHGDFNGDGRDDLLCHNKESGVMEIDFAFGGAQFNGTNETVFDGWCNGATQQLYVGDFDDDGEDDLLCHDARNGRRYFDLSAENGLDGTNEWYSNAWCNGPDQKLHVGRFSLVSGDGLLCHDTVTGYVWIDNPTVPAHIAAGDPILGASSYDEERSNFCKGGAQSLFVVNANGGTMDELVCFDSDVGRYWIDAPNGSSPYYGSINWSSGETGWCTAQNQRLRFGDVTGDGRDDAVCFDQKSGRRWIDWASGSNYYAGVTNVSNYSGWCWRAEQGLH